MIGWLSRVDETGQKVPQQRSFPMTLVQNVGGSWFEGVHSCGISLVSTPRKRPGLLPRFMRGGVEVRVDDGGPTRVFPARCRYRHGSATGLPVMGRSLPTQGSAARPRTQRSSFNKGAS